MSDSVTNVEIEDVLSSIRRLVSDGDKARTRDSAPVEDVVQATPDTPDQSNKAPESKPESRPSKFVLTPAFMVVESDAAPELEQDNTASHEDSYIGTPTADDSQPDGHDAPNQDDAQHKDVHVDSDHMDDDQDDVWVEELPDAPDAAHDDDVLHGDSHEKTVSDFVAYDVEDDASFEDEGPYFASDAAVEHDRVEDDAEGMIWGSVEEARKAGLAAVPEYDGSKSNTGRMTDRSGLIASIAELEAAISKNDQDFEPDGSEVTDDMRGEPIAWPSASQRSVEDVQDVEDTVQVDDDTPQHAETLAETPFDETQDIKFEHRGAQQVAEPEQATPDVIVQAPDAEDTYDDDDLDGLLDTAAVNLDEAALRTLVSEVVREELAGPIGERITRNVRKLVRREIHRILSSQEFD